jgi:hypothetical protein
MASEAALVGVVDVKVIADVTVVNVSGGMVRWDIGWSVAMGVSGC